MNIQTTVGAPFEIIAIDNHDNDYSLTRAYNYGAKKARFNYLVFVHEDILFHTNDWGRRLVNHLKDLKVSLVGILGCTIKTRIPSGVWVPIPSLIRINQLQRKPDGSVEHNYNNPCHETSSEVAILDGMFLATRRENWEIAPFDDELLTHFHGYDVDFSLAQGQLGKVIVIYDILIEHFSEGNFSAEWAIAQQKVVIKWKNKLPSVASNYIDKALLKEADILNLRLVLLSLINGKKKRLLQISLLLRLLYISKDLLKENYFIRHLIFGEALDKKIKALFILIKRHFQA